MPQQGSPPRLQEGDSPVDYRDDDAFMMFSAKASPRRWLQRRAWLPAKGNPLKGHPLALQIVKCENTDLHDRNACPFWHDGEPARRR
jgi:hypothetical protein